MRRVLLALLTIAACGGPAPSAAAPRPNVLLVVMDTTRADRCSFDGYDRPTTPRLAAFAKDAATFRDAWSPCCWTAPSHATLFTGLAPEKHGLVEGTRPYLMDETETLAERFAAAGWRTACFSNNDYVSPEWGLTQGFERVDALYRDPRRPYPFAAETHRRALAWALSEDEAGRPFLLFVNDMESHLPYAPPAGVASRFVRGDPTPEELAKARVFNFPWTVAHCLGREQVPERKRALLSDLYDAEIATLDDEIGRLLDGLAAAGVLDRTIVVVTADHGENLGEHARLGHQFSMHRSVLRVPLLVRYPGRFDGGRVVPDVVRLEDVAPTLYDVCGIPAPDGLDGVPLTHDLPGRVARGLCGDKAHTIAEMQRAFPGAEMTLFRTSYRSVYDGRFHLVSDSTGHEELYDIAADAAESLDLAPAGGADLPRLRALLPK